MNNIISIPIGLKGIYTVTLKDAHTDQVKTQLVFPNVITNNGLDAIGNAYSTSGLLTTGLAALAVGSGSTTASFTDIALEGYVTRSASDGGVALQYGSNTSPEYSFMRVTRLFPTSSANVQLTELGFMSNTNILFNRSLFVDAQGNPVTINKTSEDVLQVSYELRLSGPSGDVTGTIGASSFTLRPQGINTTGYWEDAVGSIGRWTSAVPNYICRISTDTFFNTRGGTNTPSTNAASSSAPSTISSASYVNGTYYRDITYYWNTAVANLNGGLSTVVVSPWQLTGASSLNRYLYQMNITPPLYKLDVHAISLIFRYSWTRI